MKIKRVGTTKEKKKMSKKDVVTVTNIQGIEYELALPVTVRAGLVIDANNDRIQMHLLNAESRDKLIKLVIT